MVAEARILKFPLDDRTVLKLLELAQSIPWIQTRKQEVTRLLMCCTSAVHANILTDIYERFQFIAGNALSECLARIANEIQNEWKLISNNTAIVCKDIEGKTDSSAALQQMVKAHFNPIKGWSSNKNFRPNIRSIILDKEIDNIVLVDDFSGTGTSLIKLLNWIEAKCYQNNRAPINVYAAYIGCMPATYDQKFPSFFKDLYSCHVCERAISDYYSIELQPEIITIIKDIEFEHGGISAGYSLGYQKSEAIFAVENLNTPNNVLPVFWSHYADGFGKPIFPRLPK